jgi:hypothetical protein
MQSDRNVSSLLTRNFVEEAGQEDYRENANDSKTHAAVLRIPRL